MALLVLTLSIILTIIIYYIMSIKRFFLDLKCIRLGKEMRFLSSKRNIFSAKLNPDSTTNLFSLSKLKSVNDG